MTLQYLRIIVDFLILLMSSPLRRFPRAQSERLFVGTVCLFSLNIVSLFQSSLATVFIKPIYYRNIENLQQFTKTDEKILIKYPAMLTDLFPQDSSELYRTLHSRMTLIPRPELTTFNITNMKMAAVIRRSSLRLSREEHLVHLIPDCPRSYNLAYLLSKKSVYIDTVNGIVLDMCRFGFINKWIDETNFKVKLEDMTRDPPVSAHARVLKMDDMQLAFFILLFGFALGLVAFIFEKKMTSNFSRKLLLW